VIVPPFLPDTPMTRIELAQYYQAVSRMDAGIGTLIEILKEEGAYDSTLIIYMSDHGIAFQGAKTTTYDPGLRSPLIVRDPNSQERGIANDARTELVYISAEEIEEGQWPSEIFDVDGIVVPIGFGERGSEVPVPPVQD